MAAVIPVAVIMNAGCKTRSFCALRELELHAVIISVILINVN